MKEWKPESSPRESYSLAGAWIAGRKIHQKEKLFRGTECRDWEEAWSCGVAVKLGQAVLESTSPGQ